MAIKGSLYKILADTWYASNLKGLAVSVKDLIEEQCPRWIVECADRNGTLRALLIFWFGRYYDCIVISNGQQGSGLVLFLEAWLSRRRRRVVVLEFIRREQPRSSMERFMYPIYFRLIKKPILQRSIKAAHVLTSWEREYYSRIYDIPENRFFFIPWPQRRTDDRTPGYSDKRSTMVLSSGRAANDWDTLFKAAEGTTWPLTIICSKKDLRHVEALNKNGRASVLCEVSLQEHQHYVESSSIYILCLKEEYISSGQVRVMNAIRGGTPIICTQIKGLDGYLIDGQTCIFVKEGDYQALRNAVELLLHDEIYRIHLAKTAFESASARTREQYLDNIKNMIIGCQEIN